jgi:formylmethanofuran dehydrogenase subunit D
MPTLYCVVLPARQVMDGSFEIRKVQAYSGERSLTFVLPKIYSEKLGIAKGDFLKVHIDDGKLVVQKADV